MSAAPSPLGLIAGGGPFPLKIAAAARAQGRPVFVVCVRDFCDPAPYTPYPHAIERVGAGGAMIRHMRAAGVREVVMAGRAKRPSLLSLMPDAWTAQALARIGPAAFRGDDTLLRAAARLLEEEGFRLLAPHQVLDEVLSDPGHLAGPVPDEVARGDIARGIAVLRALAPQDVGQACVVQQGLVLGVEAIEGTDALLARSGELRREGPGGVLVKLIKPQQDRRLDPPVIGPRTAENAAAAGLRGIAVEARETLITERAATLAACDAVGIFLTAIEPENFQP
ncbi:MAG: UDP-2,3-diacylglucosamine diphosphatase LpxI [Acetobacteraceae bacterium]|nr:UDP-2,3-diacylglucosamine diphosphatase LpxI [Acetobacteraceae bacterium]